MSWSASEAKAITRCLSKVELGDEVDVCLLDRWITARKTTTTATGVIIAVGKHPLYNPTHHYPLVMLVGFSLSDNRIEPASTWELRAYLHLNGDTALYNDVEFRSRADLFGLHRGWCLMSIGDGRIAAIRRKKAQ